MANLRHVVNHWHNVIAPNSFGRRMAKRLTKKIVRKYGDDVGAVYLVGSTASKRRMPASSINLLLIMKSDGKVIHNHYKGVYEIVDRLMAGDKGKWYFNIKPISVSSKDYKNPNTGKINPNLMGMGAEILHGKEFARSQGLPLHVINREKRASYDKARLTWAKGRWDYGYNRWANPLARQRTPDGLVERLKIEAENLKADRIERYKKLKAEGHYSTPQPFPKGLFSEEGQKAPEGLIERLKNEPERLRNERSTRYDRQRGRRLIALITKRYSKD